MNINAWCYILSISIFRIVTAQDPGAVTVYDVFTLNASNEYGLVLKSSLT